LFIAQCAFTQNAISLYVLLPVNNRRVINVSQCFVVSVVL